ncbi:MAG TPA: hypothetical protein DHV83_07550 [Prevotella sp.]|nr:hypothetical protein [Prevotella sp.]
MKGNIFRLGSMAMTMALATMGLFASCSSDDTLSQGGQGGVLTVSVTPSNAQGTRGAVTTDPTNAVENTVSRIAVGVFDSDGKVVKIVDQATTSNGIELTASVLHEGDKVLVAVNAPEKTFEGVTTPDEFKAKTLTIAQALWGAHTGTATATDKADNNHIPMYGEGAISSAGTQNFTANVNVYHLVSKVSLQSIKVDLKGAYSAATFKPTEIFMSNVPSVLGFSMANIAGSYTYPSKDVTYESGEQTTDGPTGDNTVTASKYPYLSSGKLTWDANKTYTENMPVFYTMPNNKTNGEANGATFLVIKGTFTNGSESGVCYYPVYLNYNTNSNTVPDGGTEKVLSPNYNYKVNVVINSKGSNSPTTPVDNSAATVNISAQNFVDANQTTNVNGTRIGDYVFSDGKWGPIVKEEITDKHYPIAVIFSTKPSATDIAAGYRHGYAIALASAGGQLTWAKEGAEYATKRIRSEVATDFNAVLKDYDGRTETDALKNAAGDNFTKENYPSAWYALNFGTDQVNLTDNSDPTKAAESTTSSAPYKAPAGTSGWYLGSAGQYYLVALNLGGNITSDMTWHHDNANLDADDNNAQAQWNYITGVSEANLNQLNTLFNAGASDYATVVPMVWKANTYHTWYWTSTEFSAGRAFTVYWDIYGNFNLHSDAAKSNSGTDNRGVRPVLAF